MKRKTVQKTETGKGTGHTGSRLATDFIDVGKEKGSVRTQTVN